MSYGIHASFSILGKVGVISINEMPPSSLLQICLSAQYPSYVDTYIIFGSDHPTSIDATFYPKSYNGLAEYPLLKDL